MHRQTVNERLRVEALLTVASGAPGSAALLDEAERAARRSIALTPQRAKCHLWLAAVYSERAERGDTSAVAPLEAAYRDVLRLAPVDIMARLLYARSELRLGRAREALALANETVRIDSTWAPPYVAAARARIGLGDSRGARAALERALAADWKGSDAERSEAGELLRSLEPASH